MIVLSKWESCATPSVTGAELTGGPHDGAALKRLLPLAAAQAGSARFIIFRMADPTSSEILAARDAFILAGGTARLCAAGARAKLEQLTDDRLADVGMILDELDIHTACSDVLWDRIEAVRFSSRFVKTAMADLRTGIAVDAMLSLTQELGLRALGPLEMDSVDWSRRFAFDYRHAAGESKPQGIDRESDEARYSFNRN